MEGSQSRMSLGNGGFTQIPCWALIQILCQHLRGSVQRAGAVAAEHKADRRFSQPCPGRTPGSWGALALPCLEQGKFLYLHFVTPRFCSVTQTIHESPAIWAAWGRLSTELSVGVVLFAHLQLPGATQRGHTLLQQGNLSVMLAWVGLSGCNPVLEFGCCCVSPCLLCQADPVCKCSSVLLFLWLC